MKKGSTHWSKMQNKEQHIMYFATSVITGIKSRKRAQAVHVSCMGEIKNPLKALVGNSKRKRQLKERQACIKMLLVQIS
jgi:hypothetical protein